MILGFHSTVLTDILLADVACIIYGSSVLLNVVNGIHLEHPDKRAVSRRVRERRLGETSTITALRLCYNTCCLH